MIVQTAPITGEAPGGKPVQMTPLASTFVRPGKSQNLLFVNGLEHFLLSYQSPVTEDFIITFPFS